MDDYSSSREARDPFCLQAGEAAALLAGHPWKRFVVIGDSVASGIGDRVDGYSPLPWCDRIAAELAANSDDFIYLNLGRRELKAAEVREQQLDDALRFAPDLALVVCGGNDALPSAYKSEVVDAEISAMVTALREAGADVITIGMFNVAYAPVIREAVRHLVSARMLRLSDSTAQLGARLGTIHVNMTGHPAQTDPAMYSEDGLHGNLRSHAICAAETIRGLGAHLGNSFSAGVAVRDRLAMMWAAPVLASIAGRMDVMNLLSGWAAA
ncbi:lysophospholipase L1-like esterase [Allocatelliglobosispora scoriae]|uniref:Lysophospholipase L1-like esterase n=1 Tax=Allocatelliglobosispora scoriae TaxID=643052 RepID=A0A841BWQ0_9ACTN|nr:SGNH/GDSL hydrolase family protein [Allocatelliglobosispora scoriae]MBB5872584.1 lysophospholipase L1-like esterase [Allocatelliglobosispora scoriae]